MKKQPQFCVVCRSYPITCPRCKRCQYCACGCKTCDRCKQIHPPKHFCRMCKSCKVVCKCRRIPAGLRNVPWAEGNKSLINRLPRPMGVEVELAAWGNLRNTPQQHLIWKAEHDGSVSSQQELVSSPLAGDAFVAGMLELGKNLAMNGCTVDNTCGFHVHVDARDLSWWEVRRVLDIYCRVEEDIYRYLLSPARISDPEYVQRFYSRCARYYSRVLTVPTKDSTTIKQSLVKLIYELDKLPNAQGKNWAASLERFNYSRGRKYGNGGTNVATALRARYWGLNLHSFFHRGTIEFRMKEGTVDVQELVCWPLLCGWIVHLSTVINDSTVELIRGLGDLFTLSPAGSKDPYLPEPVETWVLGKMRQVDVGGGV